MGGNSTGTSLRLSNLTPNHLDQYSTRTFSGGVDVTGLATVNSTVTVNGQTAARKEDL